MTETERERIRDTDAENQQRRYEAVSRVRRRIREELPKDVEALRQGHPELLEELRVVVGEK
jgi:hypothetical protein